MKFIKCLLGLFAFSVIMMAQAQGQNQKIYCFTIDDNIAKPAQRKTELAVSKAIEMKADWLFLRLNTFGGELEAADEIRTLLMDAPMPVIVFIDNNAASAGALISIACDSIYMASGASIGAASVVNQTGEVMPDKYQSYMRSLMRATAERNGRDPMIAQAMVDPDVYVKGVTEKGKVLSMTTQEAIANRFCEGEANSIEEVLEQAGLEDYTLVEEEISWIDRFINFLINPAVSGILIMLIIGGIYFELQSPGIGFPLIVAAAAAVLYFAPHYLEGLAAHWEIALFVVGLILLLVELFAIPGFGVFGITGIVLMVVSLTLSMIFNMGFDFHLTTPSIVVSKLLIVLTAVCMGFFLSLWLGKKLLLADTPFGSLALKTELSKEEGFVVQDGNMSQLVGQYAVTHTFLRPSGKIEVNGEILDATSLVGFIEKGEKVKIKKFENAQLIVSKDE